MFKKIVHIPTLAMLLTCSLASINHSFSQQWTQIGSSINGEAAFDNSGQSIAMNSDGTMVIIGAPGNGGSFNGAGQARVYEYTGGNWVQKGSDIDGEAQYDGSGHAVGMNALGDIIAVTATSSSSSAGQVKIYEWSGTDWTQKGSSLYGDASSSEFGSAVDLSGDGLVIVIGASKNDGSASNAGQVKVFQWGATDWIQKGTSIDGDASSDALGYAVSISASGNSFAVGAPLNSGLNVNGGQVKVYEWNTTSWVLKGSILYGESYYDRFGGAVSLTGDGNTLAVGAFMNSGAGTDAGHVRVFEWSGTDWTQKGTDIDGEAADDNSGNAVSISNNGNRVAIGAKGNDGTFGSNAVAGQVRVYSWNGSAWNQVGDDIDGESGSDYFGQSVAISADGKIVAGSAYWNSNNGTNSGDVRVFGTPAFSSVNAISESKVSIYPNPSTGIFTIDTQELITSVDVYGIDGKLLYHSNTVRNNTVDLSDYQAGIYYVSVTNAFGEVNTFALEKI